MIYFNKNIFRILLISIFLNLFFSLGYSQWIYQYIPYTYFSPASVYCMNENTVFIAGAGTIIKTTNGGLNWTSANFASNQIRSLNFVNNTTGWAAGGDYAGFLMKTVNAGSSWSTIVNGYNKFNCVYFRNINIGYIAGDGGLMLKTTNGGMNWENLDINSTNSLNSTRFFDDNTGWTVGNSGIIFKTTNGGTNWVTQSSGTINNLKQISVIDQDISYVAGTSNLNTGIILKTINGGEYWANITPDSVPTLNSLFFINQNTGWVAGNGNKIHRTSNGGSTWVNQPLNWWDAGIYQMDFCNSYIGWAVGSQVFKTTNGGSIFIKKTENIIPDKYCLYQNYPNPFNPTTKIRFEVPLSKGGLKGVVSLKVFDLLGREVATLVNEQLQPGTYEVDWNASQFTSGVYFYKIIAGDFSETKKMILMK